MTTKQAEEINNKFLKMQDSIKLLKNRVEITTIQHRITLDSLAKTSSDLKFQTGEAYWYKNEYLDAKDRVYKLAKEQNSTVFGLLVACATFTVIMLIHSGK